MPSLFFFFFLGPASQCNSRAVFPIAADADGGDGGGGGAV